MAPETSERSTRTMADDFARLRRVFTLVPWKMKRPIVFLLLSAGVSTILDMAAVAAMLPLTQILTGGGEIPELVTRYIVPIVGTSERSRLLIYLAAFVGLAFLTKNVAIIAIRWWTIGVTAKASAAAQAALLTRYVHSPYVRHRTRSKSTIIQNVTAAVPTAMTSVLLGYITLAVDLVTVVALLATMFALSPLASVAAIVIFGGAGLLVAQVLKPAALKYAWKSINLETEAWGLIHPAIEGFRESRIFQREQLFTEGYSENRKKIAGVKQPQTLLGEMPKYLLEIVMIVGILAVAFLLFATQSESTAFGLLAVFAAAAIRIIPAINRLVATYNGVRSGRPYLQWLSNELDEMDRDEADTRSTGEVPVEIPVDQPIIVRDLGFHYPDSKDPVLSDVNATIERGKTVALVGGSGAGKTTFADILVGLLDPTEGSVTVGEYDVSEHPNSWRSQLAMVSQRVYLWETTLRDLITLGQPRDEVDEQLLEDVVRRARLESLVASMPEGLDTVIGESGSRVSGGQAQRIGIARALYAQPKVLVLDEATSALDNETEYEITSTLEALHGSITVIVIAHRLSTVKNADEILYFADGRLKARGTMAELREKDADFARLVELGSIT